MEGLVKIKVILKRKNTNIIQLRIIIWYKVLWIIEIKISK
jgi:hypothetical protein